MSTRIEQQLTPRVGDPDITSGTASLGYTAPQACLSTDVPGSITEGRFAGATAVMTITATSNLLACLSAEGNTVNTAQIQFFLLAP